MEGELITNNISREKEGKRKVAKTAHFVRQCPPVSCLAMPQGSVSLIKTKDKAYTASDNSLESILMLKKSK